MATFSCLCKSSSASFILSTFKDGKYWDTWRRNTLAIARAQDVAEVLDTDYHPVTTDNVSLFQEKKKFIHAVFDKALQTDRGKKHMREHEVDYDAQLAYKKLSAFCTKSTTTRISASTTLSCVTSAKIEFCKGTAEAFILHWQDQICFYDTLVPTDSHFSEHQKRIILENAVDSVAPLHVIKDQSDQNFSHSGRELSYQQYSNLLLSAATNHIIQFSSSINNNSRKIYATDSENSNFFHDAISEVTEENIDYNMNASASALLVNMTNQSPNTCMPKEDFSSLSPEVK